MCSIQRDFDIHTLGVYGSMRYIYTDSIVHPARSTGIFCQTYIYINIHIHISYSVRLYVVRGRILLLIIIPS